MVYHLIFLFQSCRLLNSILSFQKFASITESSILYFLVSLLVSLVFIALLITYCKSDVRVPFLALFLVSSLVSYSPFLGVISLALSIIFLSLGCHSEFSVYFIVFLSTIFRNLSIVSLFWGWYLFENLS